MVLWNLKKILLLLLSVTLLLVGSVVLILQLNTIFFVNSSLLSSSQNKIPFNVVRSVEKNTGIQGAFLAESTDSYTVYEKESGKGKREEKEIFRLLLTHYHDDNHQAYDVLLYPNTQQQSIMFSDSLGQRQSIWQSTAEVIRQKAPKNALLLGWWDDSQRIHFLSGRQTWLNNPSKQTFKNLFPSPAWQEMKDHFILATDDENASLAKMARWLTMDSQAALTEIRHFFGNSRPIYFLVTNDLVTRTHELADYGGTPLAFNSTVIEVSDNLHGDIAKIKTWATETTGNGNYLAQKEGTYYHVWSMPLNSRIEKDTLLVRLLPFVESLKKLPSGIHLVYQSVWGGYVSIYQIEP